MSSTSTISAGLRADIMRSRMEDKNTLAHLGSLYVGLGTTTVIDGASINDTGELEVGATGALLQVDATGTGGLKWKLDLRNPSNPVKVDQADSATLADKADAIKENALGSGSSGIVCIISATTDGYYSLSKVSSITASSDGVVTANGFSASSDMRLKKNIIDYKCEKSILDLPVKKFQYISEENGQEHIGCLAQDLQKICPEIVHEDENGYLSIEESKIIYLLLQEVKELKDEVKKLKGE